METAVSLVWTSLKVNKLQIGFTEPMVHIKVKFPKTLEGMLSVNSMKKIFNFLKSLDIAAINNEIELLHPSTHEFWEMKRQEQSF